MGMLLTMEILRVASLLLPFLFHSVFCFPSRPLNERSTELAWQAWLLVDDQNQNKHYDSETFTRRRITPKSVFIAPTFTPESLPACAEDYRPDSMGRCIKIIRLDEEAHSKFLLEKLNAQFANYDDEIEDDSQEEVPTPGPFQLNIPLDGGASSSEEQYQDRPGDNLDIAIVVAPTNGGFTLEDSLKSTVKNADSQQTQKKAPEIENHQPDDVTSLNSKRKTENSFPVIEQVEETTLNTLETSTLPDTTSTIVQNNEDDETTTSTSQIETTTVTSTTLDVTETDSTISDQHALFFLKPSLSNTKHVQNGTNNAEDTPVITSVDHSMIIPNDSLTTLPPNSTSTLDMSSSNLSNKRHVELVNLKDNGNDPIANANPVKMEISSHSGSLMMPETYNHHSSPDFIHFPTTEEQPSITRTDYIKFPEKVTNHNQFLPHVNSNTYASQFQHHEMLPQPSSNVEHSTFSYSYNPSKMQTTSEQLSTLFNEFLHSRGADLKGNDRFVFKNHDSVTFPDNLESNLKQQGAHKTHANHDQVQLNNGYGSVINDRVYNHRNRDKHISLWSLPPSWSESSPQKPIVLRFSGRSGNGRHLLEELLLPHTQNSQAIYRQVPSEDFSYIFGADHNHNRRRSHR